MKEFFSEYGLTVVECIGSSIIISILLYLIFGGSFSGIVTNFIGTLTGG